MSELRSGQVLGERFTLIRALGRGGSAGVWLVHDRELDEQVVAKILPADAPADRIELLRRECRHARRLVHPNIARVYDFHRIGELRFVTRAHVEGDSLDRLRGAPPGTVVRAVRPIADALAYAHRHGVAHRDLKTANVVLDERGQPQLIDFGIAGLIDPAEGDPTLVGGGSRSHASPQQQAGAPPAASDDIYALGVLIHELVTGRPPAAQRSDGASSPPLRPLSGRLGALVARMLSTNPTDRPQNMEAVCEELTAIERAHDGAEPEAGVSARKPIRLTPPPRVSPIRPIAPADVAEASAAARPRRRPRRSIAGHVLFVAEIAVLLVAAWLLLPRLAERLGPPPTPAPLPSSPASSDASVPPDPGVDRETAREAARERRLATQSLDRARELARLLETMGATDWGEPAWSAARARLAEGEAHLAAGDATAATASIEEALRGLEQLDARSREVLAESLHRGDRELAAGNADAATAAFELAERIAPDDLSAERGLRRAAVLDRVLGAIVEGERHERDGRFEQAERSFREAVALDPLSRRAQESLARVQARIGDAEFAARMSEGLAALERGEFDAARAALLSARELRSEAPEVSEALAQVEEARKLDAMARHGERARELETIEQWHAAAEQYESVLDLDSTIRFAQDGRDRCRARAALADRIAMHLGAPERLASEEVLEEARDLLAEARSISQAGPLHLESVSRLGDLIERATTPVQVWLESDNLTAVTVYRVGRLGTFTRRSLDLRPGRYTVVGSRRGYRDVRHELVVVAGTSPAPLSVRCEEPI